MFLFLNLVTTFFDYFGIILEPTTCINSRIVISNENFYILTCSFIQIAESNYGGAIYFSSTILKLLIEECIFDFCITSNGYGGAIYLSVSSSGTLIINKVCGNSCMSSSYYPFGQIVYPSNSFVNTSFLSISRSISATSYHVFCIENGKINQKGFNSSLNNIDQTSGFTFNNPSYSTVSFSTISNNTESGYLTIYLHGGSGPVYFSYTNIINNRHKSISGGNYAHILWNYITFTSFDNCFFYLNTIRNLFCIGSGTVQVSNSWSDQFDLTGPTYINTHNEITLINNNEHYKTGNCFANNPIYIIPIQTSFSISLPRTYPENGCNTILKNNYKNSNLILVLQFIFF